MWDILRKRNPNGKYEKGYRRSADSPIVKLAISKERLEKAGYTFFFDDYLKVTA